jgi:hypothetical protein
MRLRPAARLAMSLALTVGGIVTACRNDVPGPTLPVAPEVTRDSPKPRPLDPKKQREQQRKQQRQARQASVSEVRPEFRAAADEPSPAPSPTRDPDAGVVNDVIDLPPVPDADVDVVRDAGQPLK